MPTKVTTVTQCLGVGRRGSVCCDQLSTPPLGDGLLVLLRVVAQRQGARSLKKVARCPLNSKNIIKDIDVTFLKSKESKGNFLKACQRVSGNIENYVLENNLNKEDVVIFWLEDDWRLIEQVALDLDYIIETYLTKSCYINFSFLKKNYIHALAVFVRIEGGGGMSSGAVFGLAAAGMEPQEGASVPDTGYSPPTETQTGPQTPYAAPACGGAGVGVAVPATEYSPLPCLPSKQATSTTLFEKPASMVSTDFRSTSGLYIRG